MDKSYFDGPGRDWLEIVPRSYAQPEFSAPAFDYRPAYTQGLHPLSPHALENSSPRSTCLRPGCKLKASR